VTWFNYRDLDNDITTATILAMSGGTLDGPFAGANWTDTTASINAITNTNQGDSYTLRRLREGIERFFITDINNPAGSTVAQSELPVMWDRWTATNGSGSTVAGYNHIPGGSNCLYMDGHVEWVKQGDKYPVPTIGTDIPFNYTLQTNTPGLSAWFMGQIQVYFGGTIDSE